VAPTYRLVLTVDGNKAQEHGVADPVSPFDGREHPPAGGCSVRHVFRTVGQADMTHNQWSTRRDFNAHLQ
jgi:hypothetical protein